MNHNCAAHQCQTTRTRRVLQERQLTDKLEHEVNHAVEPNDCFVNLAQLRSATEVQKFRSGFRFPGLSLVDAIEQSIQNRERMERETKEAEEAKEAERQQKASERLAKAAEKQAKATRKELATSEKGPNGGKKSKVNSGAHLAKEKGKKRKREEVDRDFAEGEEELVYRPRPSKSRGGQE